MQNDRQHFRVGDITVADLRARFEPLGLTANGFSKNAQVCAEDWDLFGGKKLCREFESAVAWLSLCEQTKTINQNVSSYGLKHEAERWCRDQGHAGGGYICNGALLMAAYHLGFRVQRDTPRSPNGCLNIGKKRPHGSYEL